MATDAMRRHYALPETMEHPAVSFECLRLAYLIQAYGLASIKSVPQHAGTEKPRDTDTAARHQDSDVQIGTRSIGQCQMK